MTRDGSTPRTRERGCFASFTPAGAHRGALSVVPNRDRLERNERSDILLLLAETDGDATLDFAETRPEFPRVTGDPAQGMERPLRRRDWVGDRQRIELTGSQPAIEAPGARTKISTRRFWARALGFFEGTRGWCGP